MQVQVRISVKQHSISVFTTCIQTKNTCLVIEFKLFENKPAANSLFADESVQDISMRKKASPLIVWNKETKPCITLITKCNLSARLSVDVLCYFVLIEKSSWRSFRALHYILMKAHNAIMHNMFVITWAHRDLGYFIVSKVQEVIDDTLRLFLRQTRFFCEFETMFYSKFWIEVFWVW